MATTTTCAHPGCHCTVPPERAAKNNRYCSDYCEQHSAQAAHQEHACACGHASCK
jgi:hypothetical protein